MMRLRLLKVSQLLPLIGLASALSLAWPLAHADSLEDKTHDVISENLNKMDPVLHDLQFRNENHRDGWDTIHQGVEFVRRKLPGTPRCDPLTHDDKIVLALHRNPPYPLAESPRFWEEDLEPWAEQQFFARGAKIEIRELQCLSSQVKKWQPSDLNFFAQDFASKLKALRSLKALLEKAKRRALAYQLKDTLDSIGLAEDPLGTHIEFEKSPQAQQALKEFQEVRGLFAGLYESTPLAKFPEGRELMKKVMDSSLAPKDFLALQNPHYTRAQPGTPRDFQNRDLERINAEVSVRTTIEEIARNAESSIQEYAVQMHSSSKNQIELGTERRLFTRGHPELWFDPRDIGTPSAHRALCHLDQEVGRGARNADTWLYGAGAAGVTVAFLPLGAWLDESLAGVVSAEALSGGVAISQATVGTLAAAVDFYSFGRSIYRSCLEKHPTYNAQGACRDALTELRLSTAEGSCLKTAATSIISQTPFVGEGADQIKKAFDLVQRTQDGVEVIQQYQESTTP
jgi:hypothetical protein